MDGTEAQNTIGVLLALKQLYDSFQQKEKDDNEKKVYLNVIQQPVENKQPTSNQSPTYNSKLFGGAELHSSLKPDLGVSSLVLIDAIRSAGTTNNKSVAYND